MLPQHCISCRRDLTTRERSGPCQLLTWPDWCGWCGRALREEPPADSAEAREIALANAGFLLVVKTAMDQGVEPALAMLRGRGRKRKRR